MGVNGGDAPRRIEAGDRDAIHVVAIMRALTDSQRFLGDLTAEGFRDDDKTQNAVAMAIARVGEHVKRLSPEFREGEPETAWKAIAGTRDWIVHDYDDLDFDRLYYAVRHEVPRVIAVLQQYVDDLSGTGPVSGSPFDVPMA